MSYGPNSYEQRLRAFMKEAMGRLLTSESPRAEQPDAILTPLRPHQQTLLAAARALEQQASFQQLKMGEQHLLTRFGVIADRVGAGKSLVALSLICDPPVAQTQFEIKESGAARLLNLQHLPAVQEPTDDWPTDDNDALMTHLMGMGRKRRYYARASLIVAPHNVVAQWESYIRAQTSLRAVIVKRTRDCDYDRKGFYNDVFRADVVLVSCTMMRKFAGAMAFQCGSFERIVWSRLFLDEADSLTFTLRPSDVSARFVWFITGSWMNMLFPCGMQVYENSVAASTGLPVGFIDGLRHAPVLVRSFCDSWKDPAFLQLILRNRDAWIDASLARPMIENRRIVCEAPADLRILGGFVSPAAMEALHAGDTAGAVAAMGLHTESAGTLVERVTAGLRADVAQAEKILEFKRGLDYSSAAAKAEGLVKAEAKLVRLREQLAALEARVAASLSDQQSCPICFDVPRSATLTPCCRQAFCLACLCECIVKNPVCPMCRAAIRSASELLVVGEEMVAGGAGTDTVLDVGLPTKGAALLALLSESTADQRFLVFSAHEASFRGLREVLATRGIGCEMLMGTAARMERLRRQFREGKVRVLCMNARHVGAGINLEAATHVVLYHRMNTELERQVIGRAVRFERAERLTVVRLEHEGETALTGARTSNVIVHV